MSADLGRKQWGLNREKNRETAMFDDGSLLSDLGEEIDVIIN